MKNACFKFIKLKYIALDAANSQPSNTPNAAAPKEFDPLSAKEDGSRNKVASSFGLQEGKPVFDFVPFLLHKNFKIIRFNHKILIFY